LQRRRFRLTRKRRFGYSSDAFHVSTIIFIKGSLVDEKGMDVPTAGWKGNGP